MITVNDLFDLGKCLVGDELKRFKDDEPWTIIRKIPELVEILANSIRNTYQLLDGYEEYRVMGSSDGYGVTFIHRSSKIVGLLTCSGSNIIGPNCEIRPGTYLRGNVIASEGCVLGNSCEFKNSILFNNVQVPHFSYVGDSILGYKSHLGAGAKISNLKLDGTNVKINGAETSLRKCGAFLGDGAQIGCNSVLNPGTIIGRNSIVYPGVSFRGILKENTILKDAHTEITRS